MCAGAAAAAAATAFQRRQLSCDGRRCDDNDDDDDAATVISDKSLRRTSSSSAVARHCRRHRDNSIVLVEVIHDCHGTKQQARTPPRPRPRSASGSPSHRSRLSNTGPVTGPASDSEVNARRTPSCEFCDSGSAVLQLSLIHI